METVWCEVDVADCAHRMRASYGEGARPVLVAGRGIVRLADALALQGYGGALHPFDARWLAWSIEAQAQGDLFTQGPRAPRELADYDWCAEGADPCAAWLLMCLGVRAPILTEDEAGELYDDGRLVWQGESWDGPWQGWEPTYHGRDFWDTGRWVIGELDKRGGYCGPMEAGEGGCSCGATSAHYCKCADSAEDARWCWVEEWVETASQYGARSVNPLVISAFDEQTTYRRIYTASGGRWVDEGDLGYDDPEPLDTYENLTWGEIVYMLERHGDRADFFGSVAVLGVGVGPLGEPYSPRAI